MVFKKMDYQSCCCEEGSKRRTDQSAVTHRVLYLRGHS